MYKINGVLILQTNYDILLINNYGISPGRTAYKHIMNDLECKLRYSLLYIAKKGVRLWARKLHTHTHT